MIADLPTDTILDITPPRDAREAREVVLLKVAYLQFEELAEFRERWGWTATKLIDCAEAARQLGYIDIEIEDAGSADVRVTLAVTQLGHAIGWLRRNGEGGGAERLRF